MKGTILFSGSTWRNQTTAYLLDSNRWCSIISGSVSYLKSLGPISPESIGHLKSAMRALHLCLNFVGSFLQLPLSYIGRAVVSRCKSPSSLGSLRVIIPLIFFSFIGPFKARALGSSPRRPDAVVRLPSEPREYRAAQSVRNRLGTPSPLRVTCAKLLVR